MAKKIKTVGSVLHGDCLELVPKLHEASVDLAFADPPFNINWSYDEYVDKKTSAEYLAWCEAWIADMYRVLKSTGTFWLMTGDWFASELDIICKRLGFYQRSKVIWYYTFGQNNKTNFTRSHTNIFYYTKSKKGFTFNAEDPELRVPSARQAIYKDKRASSKGRLPDTVWMLYEQQFKPVIQPTGDVWYNSRVAGTFRERVEGATCQVPAPIMERIIRACSRPGDLVLDPFCGSGATALAALRLGRNFWTCDISKAYILRLRKELDELSRETGVELVGDTGAA